MKRIIEYRKMFDITADTDLNTLKLKYRSLMKEWHPDKFSADDEKFAEAEAMSKSIIEAYHFLVSVSPETHATYAQEYENSTNAVGFDNFEYKGQTLTIIFLDGCSYEYFAVPNNIYNKLLNSPTPARFARRHIFSTYIYRNVSKSMVLA